MSYVHIYIGSISIYTYREILLRIHIQTPQGPVNIMTSPDSHGQQGIPYARLDHSTDYIHGGLN